MRGALPFSTTLAVALTLCAAAAGADLNGAQAFVTALYAHYPAKDGAPVFDPAGRSAPEVFDPSMVRLISDEAAATPKGDVGAIDGDPICDCQDSAGMTARIASIHATGPSHALASVELVFGQAAPPDIRHLDLDLVAIGDQWRVYDIRTDDQPSLRAFLEQSIVQAKAAQGR
jgi:hypothetical protein